MNALKEIGRSGWFVLIGAFLLMFTTLGMAANGMTLFYVPVAVDLGFTQTQFSFYTTIGTIANMVFAPFVGVFWSKYFKRFRIIGLICGLLIAACMIGYGFCTVLWQFYVISVIRGFLLGFVAILPASMLVNHWFPKNRAFMTSVVFIGSSVGGIFFTQISSYFITNAGWKTAYIVLGIACVVFYAVIMLLVKPYPADYGTGETLEGEGSEAKDKGDSAMGIMLGDALKMPAFWLMLISFFLGATAAQGIQQCLATSLMLDYGHTPAFAAMCYTVFIASAIGGKLLIGFIYDKFGIKVGLLNIGIAMVACCICLLLSGNVLFAVMACVFFGVGNLVGTLTSTTVMPDIFGLKDYSRIFGILTLVTMSSMAVGITFSSAIYDTLGSYRPAWWVYIFFNIAHVGLLLLSKRMVRGRETPVTS